MDKNCFTCRNYKEGLCLSMSAAPPKGGTSVVPAIVTDPAATDCPGWKAIYAEHDKLISEEKRLAAIKDPLKAASHEDGIIQNIHHAFAILKKYAKGVGVLAAIKYLEETRVAYMHKIEYLEDEVVSQGQRIISIQQNNDDARAALDLVEAIKRVIPCALFFLLCVTTLFAVEPPPDLWKGLVAENTKTQSYEEFYATACCYRNRLEKGMSLGCVAMKRKDLDSFVAENVAYVQRVLKRPIKEWAQRAVREAFNHVGADPTNGATHYEDVEIYGLPYWAKGKKVLAKVGIRTFFE